MQLHFYPSITNIAIKCPIIIKQIFILSYLFATILDQIVSKNEVYVSRARQVGTYIVYPFYHVGQPDDWMANTFRNLPITLDKITYPTTEHYFHSMKFPGNSIPERKFREAVLNYKGSLPSGSYSNFQKDIRTLQEIIFNQYGNPPNYDRSKPNEVKAFWKEWDEKRSIAVMTTAVKAKLDQYPKLRDQLVNRPINAMIVEATDIDGRWADLDNGKGQNQLGKIYMRELRERHPEAMQQGALSPDDVDEDYQLFNGTRMGRSLYSYPEIKVHYQVPSSKQPHSKIPPAAAAGAPSGESKQLQQEAIHTKGIFAPAPATILGGFEEKLLQNALTDEIKQIPIVHQVLGKNSTVAKLVFKNPQDLDYVYSQFEEYRVNNIRKELKDRSEPTLSIEIPKKFLDDGIIPEIYLQIFLKIAGRIKELEKEYKAPSAKDKNIKIKKINGLKELINLISTPGMGLSMINLTQHIRTEKRCVENFKLDHGNNPFKKSKTTALLDEIETTLKKLAPKSSLST